MKFNALFFCFAVAVIAGCNREPQTLREKADAAQQDLADARVDAAEMIAEAEEDAVDRVADARQDAQEEVLEAKQEASELVQSKEEHLQNQLEQLATPGESNPGSP